MEHPLTNVYFTERCNVCGDAYPVTLYQIYREQQLAEEWQAARPCSSCAEHQQRLVAAVPKEELAAAMQAWDRLAAALNARGLVFEVSAPAEAKSGSHQDAGN
jgi:hypothetical protein